MAQNSIEIFDDTVLKLTVNQGTESERSITTAGNFTMGELAFVRNTGRLFVGDCSDDETLPTTTESGEINYTKGGILAGNRYLGIIDSKPLAESSNDGRGNGLPLYFEKTTPVGINVLNEKAIIGSDKSEINEVIIGDGKFKKQMIVDGDDEGQKTAYRWNRNAEYNEQYDAYNGDMVYDVYNNAIILFDKNITTDVQKQRDIIDTTGHPYSDSEHGQYFKDENGNNIYDINDKVNVKRRTPIENLESTGSGNPSDRFPVYGNGYVVFRNIEPDNETIEFVHKEFDSATGEPKSDARYSHNVLQIKNLPFDKITANFNENQFVTKDGTNFISIKDKLGWVTEIGTDDNVTSLKIPRKIEVKQGSSVDKFTIEKIGNNISQSLVYVEKISDGYKLSAGSAPVYSFKLGNGLISTSGKQVNLGPGFMPTISLDDGVGGNAGYIDPFCVEEDSITPILSGDAYSYIDQFTIFGGMIVSSGRYEDEYVKTAAEWISKYQSDKNISINFLKTPIALTWTTATGTAGPFSINTEFYDGDYLFCLNGKVYSSSGESSSTSVKIFTNGAPATGKAPLDIDAASISGTKNAYRYYGQMDYELNDDGVPQKIKINESQFVLLEWQYNSETGITIINGDYTPDGTNDRIDEIKIGDLQLWKNNAEGSDFARFNTIKKKTQDSNTVYSICIDAKDIISNVYYKITYSLFAEEGETPVVKAIDLVKKGYVKFLQSIQLLSENGKWYIGPNKEYEVSKFYTCSNFDTGALTNFTPTSEADIKNKESVVFEIQDEDAEDEEPYFLFYRLINCPENETYRTKEITNDDYKIRIPLHAKKALVEVTVYKSSGEEEIGIFTADKFSNLKTTFTNESTPYEHVSGEQPTLHTAGMLNPGEKEVALGAIKASRFTTLIEVPIYHDEITDKPYFVLRFGNVNTNSYFIAKLVGYSV